MFTGIVRGIGKIVYISKKKDFFQFKICTNNISVENLTSGSSIACNGCCLTIKKIFNNIISVDVIKETLESTNLKFLDIGHDVNLERPLKFGEEVSGHLISGHIIVTGIIYKQEISLLNKVFWIKLCNAFFIKYIFHKGFICVDGISLTVGLVTKNTFCISLIPETILRTTIGSKNIGDLVNIEIDFYTQIAVDSLERILSTHLKKI